MYVRLFVAGNAASIVGYLTGRFVNIHLGVALGIAAFCVIWMMRERVEPDSCRPTIQQSQALRYIRFAGTNATAENFLTDFGAIGSEILEGLHRENWIEESNGVLRLTDEGQQTLDNDGDPL